MKTGVRTFATQRVRIHKFITRTFMVSLAVSEMPRLLLQAEQGVGHAMRLPAAVHLTDDAVMRDLAEATEPACDCLLMLRFEARLTVLLLDSDITGLLPESCETRRCASHSTNRNQCPGRALLKP